MLITADQIRAARGLINWSQTELAHRTGLAVPTIANIELGKQLPGKGTIEKIIDAFALGGVRFTKNGVEFDKDEIVSIVGLGKFKNVLVDAISTLEKKAPKDRDFMVLNADDTRTSEEELLLYKEMAEKGITYRRIVSDKAKFLHHEYKQSRKLEHKYFDEKGAVFMFDDKLAFYTAAEDGKEPTTLIITNYRISEVLRKIFSFMWDNTEEIKNSDEPKKKGRK